MKKITLAEVGTELVACETKLKTEPDGDTIHNMHQLLQERTQLLFEDLNPLRTAVSDLLGFQPNMAASKKWGQNFRKLPPSTQLKMYEAAKKAAEDLAGVLNIGTRQEGS
jgi:hypothetical protein